MFLQEHATLLKHPDCAHNMYLPVMSHKKTIMNLIKNNCVVIIQSGTGSGKSTRIPQFIFEQCNSSCKIIVAQPRCVIESPKGFHMK